MNPKITRQGKTTVFRIFLFSVCLTGSISFLAASSGFAGEEEPGLPDYRFERFELPGGMLGNSVQSIVQDSFGFLWFASQAGLHRYDGYHIKTFLHDPEDPTSLSGNYAEWLLVDRQGRLWIGLWGRGLNRFDYETERFVRYEPDPVDEQGLSNGFISMMVEDSDSSIWVATMDGLHRLDPQTGQFERFRHDPVDPGSLSNNEVRALYIDRENTLWVGTGFPWDGNSGGGLNRYDRQSNTFERFLHDPDDPRTLSGNEVRAIFEDEAGNFWVGTHGDGLHLMDRQSGTFQRLPHDPAQPRRLSQPHLPNSDLESGVTFIFQDQRERLWIGAYNGGLVHYDPATEDLRHYYFSTTSSSGLNTNYLWAIFQSRDGTLWVAGGSGGQQVYRLVPRQNDFQVHSFDRYLISTGAVQSITERRNGEIWTGTEIGGLLRFFPQTGTMQRYQRDPGNPAASLSSDNIHVVYEDRRGVMWIGFGHSGGGLDRLDPGTGRITHFRFDPDDPGSLSNDNVVDIIEDQQGQLWVATAGGGLNRYDAAADRFTQYKGGEEGPLPHDYLTRLFVDRTGNLWVGSGGGVANPAFPMVMSRYNPQSGRFTHFEFPFHQKEPFPWVSSIHEDEEGYLWLTSHRSLIRLDPDTKAFRRLLHDQESIYRSEIKGAVRDDTGNFWIMGNEGLTIYDPQGGNAMTYNRINGAPWKNFFWHALYKLHDGTLLFGTLEAVYLTHPDHLLRSLNNRPPQPVLTEFRVFDEPVRNEPGGRLDAPLWKAERIVLPYHDNVFSFDFAALHFQQPESNRLEYRLENFDRQWRTAGSAPTATYIKVPPGEYRFRVRAANAFGIWNEEEAAIDLVILPPWYRTFWAYLLFGLGGAALIFLIYRAQLNRQLVKAEAARLRELNEVKTKLYTNITHEFRTPLTIISGMADQIAASPEQWLESGVAMIRRNSEQLLQLVNQLLDLRKLESGKLPLQLRQSDIVAYLRYGVESFHSYAMAKGVELQFRSEEEQLLMDYDPEKLLNILSNLLSNAFKFTPAGGAVRVDVRQVSAPAGMGPAEEGKALQIEVRDTGSGIAPEKLAHVFDLFYQADDTPTRRAEGTGVGLALTQELVRLMQGRIEATSAPGEGATFTVMLPVRRSAPFRPAEPPVVSRGPAVSATAPETEPAPVAGEQASLPLALLIEDNADVLRYLGACLQGRYRVATAADGRRGIEQARELVPDIIVSDVMMPECDGFEVCRTLKADERTSHIPIIMLTAKTDVDSRLEGLELGAEAYLEKPFHRGELLLRLRKLLELRDGLRTHYLASAGLTEDAVVIRELPDVSAREDAFVQRARALVEDHLDDFDFDVRAFCDAMNLSRSQLHRKLTAVTGLSPNKFIRFVRLHKARELLHQTEEPIGNIAFDTGFQDPDYFGRVFRQEVGVTPSEFREKGGVISEAGKEIGAKGGAPS